MTLVVGPSGAGKDTLIRGAKAALAGDGRFVFPCREITRPPGDRNEAHVALEEAEFRARQAGGAYALSWRAHGLGYGVPREIEDCLKAGQTVVVNVSREIVTEARRRFARVTVVSVSAPESLLQGRLAARGREPQEAIAGRLRRAPNFEVEGPEMITLVNDRAPEHAIAEFVHLLRGLNVAA